MGDERTTCWRGAASSFHSFISRAVLAAGPCKLEKSGPAAEREAKNNHLCALPGINTPAPLGKKI